MTVEQRTELRPNASRSSNTLLSLASVTPKQAFTHRLSPPEVVLDRPENAECRFLIPSLASIPQDGGQFEKPSMVPWPPFILEGTLASAAPRHCYPRHTDRSKTYCYNEIKHRGLTHGSNASRGVGGTSYRAEQSCVPPPFHPPYVTNPGRRYAIPYESTVTVLGEQDRIPKDSAALPRKPLA